MVKLLSICIECVGTPQLTRCMRERATGSRTKRIELARGMLVETSIPVTTRRKSAAGLLGVPKGTVIGSATIRPETTPLSKFARVAATCFTCLQLLLSRDLRPSGDRRTRGSGSTKIIQIFARFARRRRNQPGALHRTDFHLRVRVCKKQIQLNKFCSFSR